MTAATAELARAAPRAARCPEDHRGRESAAPPGNALSPRTSLDLAVLPGMLLAAPGSCQCRASLRRSTPASGCASAAPHPVEHTRRAPRNPLAATLYPAVEKRRRTAPCRPGLRSRRHVQRAFVRARLRARALFVHGRGRLAHLAAADQLVALLILCKARPSLQGAACCGLRTFNLHTWRVPFPRCDVALRAVAWGAPRAGREALLPAVLRRRVRGCCLPATPAAHMGGMFLTWQHGLRS